ncbi:hypothetical protein C8T65DRAFT_745049 [Cerioporus squamosus]|nr:hypothetical protein C8T65DRAFT_745049 [Cerioporus squamosus]
MASSLPDYEDDETCTLRSDDGGENEIEGSHSGAPVSPQYVCPTSSSLSPVSPIYTVSREASNEFGLDEDSQHHHSAQDEHEHQQQQHDHHQQQEQDEHEQEQEQDEHKYSAAPAVILPAGFRRELYPPDTEDKLEHEELGLRDDPTLRQPVVDRDVISHLEHSGVVIDRQEHIVLPLGFRDEVYGGLSVVKPILANHDFSTSPALLGHRSMYVSAWSALPEAPLWTVVKLDVGKLVLPLPPTALSIVPAMDLHLAAPPQRTRPHSAHERVVAALRPHVTMKATTSRTTPLVHPGHARGARDDGDEDQASPPHNLWGGPRLTAFGEDIGRVAAAEER